MNFTKPIANDLFGMIHLIGIAVLVAMLFKKQLRASFERRCVGEATAIDLAWIRILACGTLLVYIQTEDLGSHALLDEKWYDWPGYLIHLGRGALRFFMESEGNLDGLTALLQVFCLLGLFGIATRITIPITIILYILYAALLRAFGKYFHDGYLVMYALMVLAFLPCADAWSVDAWLRKWRYRRRGETPPVRTAAYNWMVWACWAAICVAYLQLATSKFANGGLYWFDGRSLRNYMLADDLCLTEWNFDFAMYATHAPTLLWTIAGFFALAAETLYPFALVSHRIRRTLPYCVALLHLGVWFGQDALFVDAILMPFAFWQPSKRLFPPPVELDPPSRPPVPWWRAAWIPIVIAAGVFFCDYVTYRNTFRYKWPLEGWQMYAGKSYLGGSVNFRRFYVTYPDGSTKDTGLADCAAFLEKPYRLDFGLIRDMPRFLSICLPRHAGAIALTFETRTWSYRRQTLEEHFATIAPDYAFRVQLEPHPPIALRIRQRGPQLLVNGTFEDLNLSTGHPVGWIVLPEAFVGFGFDRATNDHSFLLAKNPQSEPPVPQTVRQLVELPPKGERTLTASVLARTLAPGGKVAIELDGSEPTSVAIPADGTWHRVEVSTRVPAVNTRASLALVTSGDTWFDDAMLTVTTGGLADTGPPVK